MFLEFSGKSIKVTIPYLVDDGFKRTFRSENSFNDWLNREIKFWKTFYENGKPSHSAIIAKTLKALETLSGLAKKSMLSKSASLKTHTDILEKSLFTLSDAPMGKFLKKCYGQDPETSQIMIERLGNQNYKSNAKIASADYLISAYLQNDITTSSVKSTVSNRLNEFTRDHKKAMRKANEQVKDISSLYETLNADYELRAPAKYWQSKAIEHKENENKLGTNFFFYAIFCTIIVLIYFGALLYTSAQFYNIEIFATAVTKPEVPKTELPLQLSFLIAGLTLALSTILIWGGRIFARMFLSEKHLRMDAEERAVMVETYLALIKEAAADKDDKTIILTSLFRPTEDGIVKDDAAPMFDFSNIPIPSK